MGKTELPKQIADLLLEWFAEHARSLPWRERPEPYFVWVSEIMLQQTRVEAVKSFFQRFTEALPDVQALAECPQDKLLKLWEGLGYYNRVRNMQKAAQTIMEEYGGNMPADYEKLLALQGIGPYTAGAVASIAFQIPAPAVDGNVLRVISRLAEEEGDIAKQSVKRKVERMVMEIMPYDRAGAFNQALMELGATVCVPNGAPQCGQCPVAEFCLAHQNGHETGFPKKAPKKERKIEKKTVLVIGDGTFAVLRKRPEKGLLAGLYELPNLAGHISEAEALGWVKAQGFQAIRIWKLPAAKHIFTHIEWQMTGYAILTEELEKPEKTEGSEKAEESKKTEESEKEAIVLAKLEQTEEAYSIPSAFRAYTGYLKQLQGKTGKSLA